MTIATVSSDRKTSVAIIIAALCIHGSLGSLLFLLEPHYGLLSADEAQVILVDEQSPKKHLLTKTPHTTLVPEKEEWGLVLPEELLMLAGRQATTKKNDPTKKTTSQPPASLPQKATPLNPSEEKPNNTTITPPTSSLSLAKNSQTDAKQSGSKITATKSPSSIKIEQNEEKHATSTQEKSINTSQQQNSSISQKKLSLASIGKGFLEQLPRASYGKNFMPGSQRAKMAATQIAIEEYNARVEKMISPFIRTIFREVPITRAVTHAPCFGFNTSPNGKLIDMCIIESSGDTSYDQQLLTKIKESNLWGPPLPESFLKARAEKHFSNNISISL